MWQFDPDRDLFPTATVIGSFGGRELVGEGWTIESLTRFSGALVVEEV